METDGAGKAMSLTPQAKTLLEKFGALERETQERLQQASQELAALLEQPPAG